jgi:DNA invertase Pin-like site-specific DNA recombinase
MLIGYMRVSTASVRGPDGKPDAEEAAKRERQLFDLQHDALLAAGIDLERIYKDRASGKSEDRPQLEACLKALRSGDTLVVWKLDRLGRSLSHLLRIVEGLKDAGVKFRSLTESMIDTTTPQGEMLFGFFGLMAQYERALIRERVAAGLDAARKRGRVGGAAFKMTPAKLRLAEASMAKPGTTIGELAKELGVSRQTLYRHVAPDGQLRPLGEKLLAKRNSSVTLKATGTVG